MNLTTILILIIAVLFIFGLLYLCYIIPEFKPIVLIFAGVFILVCGVYTTYENIVYLSSHNMTVGETLDSVFNTSVFVPEDEDQTKNMSFVCESLSLVYEKDDTYTATIVLPQNTAVDFEKNTYLIALNGEPCFTNENGGSVLNPYIKAQYVYDFFDINNNLLLEDTLNVDFVFYNTKTVLSITTCGGEQAVSLWQAYVAKNGLIISIEEVL